MGGSCKAICMRFDGVVLSQRGGFNIKYSDGWVRCTECEIFIKTKELRCRCCHQLFRRNTRQKKIKYII